MPLVQRLSGQPLGTSLESIRNRLILSWRFFQLSRSIDLARTFRKVSMVGDVPFIWVQRKGWPRPRWEEVVCLPSCPELCPWALLKLYVSKSSALPAGSLLLRGLRPPFAPLTSNSIGSLTRRMLHLLGLPPGAWGPHSTRGAGVLMYKTLGLSSEEVCEIGKWKNTGAFSSHYLRLGAPQQAGRRLERFVHSVSSGEGAELSRNRQRKVKGRRTSKRRLKHLGLMPVGDFPTGRCLSRDRETNSRRRRTEIWKSRCAVQIPCCNAGFPREFIVPRQGTN